MIIRSKNFILKLEEILKDNLPTERYNEHENFVLNMIRGWHSTEQSFIHQTSGSTGRPKKITISRDKIKISAKATMDFIDPTGEVTSSLLCLNPQHIGGAMVVYRSLIYDQDLMIVEPTSHPMEELENETFDLVSMVPMQFKELSEADMDRFGTILIGGAPVEVRGIHSTAKIYSTFGMTETVSHIALRSIDEDLFTTTGDTKVAADEDGSLKIMGAITDHAWMHTNDLVCILSDKKFKWIGRKDFVINSGGIKINPEEIEQALSSNIHGEIMVSSIPDDRLGQKLVLLCSGSEEGIDMGELAKYQTPKAIYFNQKIFKFSNGKLDRKKTQEEFERSL